MNTVQTLPSTTPVHKFGKDHWSLLAYAECCCVDGHDGVGALDHARMRSKHRSGLIAGWKPQYSTRLKGFFEYEHRANPEVAIAAGFMLRDHDDFDCLVDLESAGFLEIQSADNRFVKLKPAGVAAAAEIRRHKAGGAHFAAFEPSPSCLAMLAQ